MLDILERAPIFPVSGGLPLKDALATCPRLRDYLIKKDPPKIDLQNREALRLYNTAIAKQVFGLELHLEDFAGLIPTPVLRYNFLKHLNPQNQRILEVGTGYTAIISMLAAKHFNAQCVATELNPDSIQGALSHITLNNLEEKITILPAKEGKLIAGVVPEGELFDLVITNPPYYYEILSPKVIWAGNPDELLIQKEGQENFCVQFFREADPYLKPGGSSAMLVSGKQTQILEEIFAALDDNGCAKEVIGLRAGTRIRWLIRAYSTASASI
ncbi:MAG TPA: RlmF-related methyltransferase [Candidatus Lokiarchaeia archaeon]|nr:RlmF-related methyltransferase [Candidatus Lokiarchaeia archaeon]